MKISRPRLKSNKPFEVMVFEDVAIKITWIRAGGAIVKEQMIEALNPVTDEQVKEYLKNDV